MADDLRKNAQRLLREAWKTPGALAQELYTIVSGRADGALSARSPQAQARAQSPGVPAPTPPAPSPIRPASPRRGTDPGVSNPRTLDDLIKRGGYSPALAFEPAAPGPPAPGDAPGPASPSPAPVAPERTKPYRMDPPFPDYDYNLAIPGGDGGTSVFGGYVVGGGGGQPVVTLYPNGSQGAPGATVTVNIVQLAAGEDVPIGTWISGIQQFTDSNQQIYYEAQIPIWLA